MTTPTLTVAKSPVLGTARRSRARVRRSEFEGGYSQRSSVGPGNVDIEVSLEWSPLTEAETDNLVAFLEARRGSEPFYYQAPGEAAATLWSCSEWTETTLDQDDNTVTATFRRERDLGL